MNDSNPAQVLYLSYEAPWPTFSGAALRSLGLLKELSRNFQVSLVLLTRQPLTKQQTDLLGTLASSVARLPLADTRPRERGQAIPYMLRTGYPYHSAILELSFAQKPKIRQEILNFRGIVFTSTGHWGTLVRDRHAPNWILNQCDADVEFWRVYASQATRPMVRLAARMNYQLARFHYPRIYNNVGHIISVCEEDRQQTLALAPSAHVDVIENGVDCSYYYPSRPEQRVGPPRLLFTGTSAARNMKALHNFVAGIFPAVRQAIPDVELLVGGNFSAEAQGEFAGVPNLRFTGRIDDIRPLFDQSDVFVAPFDETHGSKLKIAEAMAMALPIVSTPQGIRGFPLIDGESVAVAKSAAQFAEFTIRLLQNGEQRNTMGMNARAVAEANIAWEVLGKRLMDIVCTVRQSLQAPQKTA